MDIKEKLILLRNYYKLNRQVGHTTVALNGILSTKDAVIIASTHRHRQQLRNIPDPPLSASQVRVLGNDLRSMNKPIVLDNHTVYFICCEALDLIEELEAKLEEGK